jgi:C4-dicarboxylate transporter DctM subunit
MFIIANIGLFSWILSREQVPQLVSGFFTSVSSDPIIFLLLINALLLLVGMFMETGAAIIILAPLLTPVAITFGIDPVQFGMIMIVNLAVGMCTPPLGVNLFISCQIANIRLEQITKGLVPFYIVMLVCLMLITFIPALSTWLPGFIE